MQYFTSSDGLKLAYHDEGQGIPVLCLAGLTRNSSDFDDFAEQVGKEVRLIRPDYRGRGASDYDADFNNYAVPVEARDALELLDHLNIERAVIVGTSRGGLIAMVLAATAQTRLSGVLLNDIGPEIAPAGLELIMNYLGRDPEHKSFTKAAEALARFYSEDFPGISEARWLTVAKRLFRETNDGPRINYDAKLRDAVLATSAQPAPDLWPLFDALQALPTALVRGANSDLLTKATAEEMIRRQPGMIYTEVPDRGHVPFLDEPQAITAFRQLIDKVKK